MKILLTNDDGYTSSGLMLLATALSEEGHEVYVVAPDGQRSAFSHSVNFYKPITIKKLSDYCNAKEAYICSGTPVDCVKFATSTLNVQFDLLVSGPNNGENYGVCVLYSGTVGAAEEGAICNVRSIALSRCGHGGSFAPAVEFFVNNFDELYRCCEPRSVLNINLPDMPLCEIKGVKVVPQNSQELFNDYMVKQQEEDTWTIEGDQYELELDETDVPLVREGYVTITPLTIDHTDYSRIACLKKLEK